jgi:hypothetical protein
MSDDLPKRIDLTMSPAYFAVRNEQLDDQLEAAHLAGDFSIMEELSAEQNQLLEAMFGLLA